MAHGREALPRVAERDAPGAPGRSRWNEADGTPDRKSEKGELSGDALGRTALALPRSAAGTKARRALSSRSRHGGERSMRANKESKRKLFRDSPKSPRRAITVTWPPPRSGTAARMRSPNNSACARSLLTATLGSANSRSPLRLTHTPPRDQFHADVAAGAHDLLGAKRLAVLSIVGYEWLRRPIIELGVGDAMPRAAGRGCLTLAASPGGWPDSARAFRPMVTTVGRLAVLPRHGGPAPPIQPSVAEAIVLLSRPRPLEVVPGHDE